MSQDPFNGRLGIQQRVLPAYRAPFLDLLASSCQRGLGVFAGKPLASESVAAAGRLEVAELTPAFNLNIGPITSPVYQCWQANILQWLEDWQPDVLVVEANWRYLSTFRAIKWMHRRGRPVLGWGLGVQQPGGLSIDKPENRGLLASWIWRRRVDFLKSLDGVIAYSHRGAEEYRRMGFPGERVFIAPNAVDPRPGEPPPAKPAGFEQKPVVLFVGRLQARKRLESLMQACAGLPASLQPELWIVGDGPAREQFQNAARAYYPPARFFGSVHGAELEKFWHAADLFVLPGTGGLAVQQAMAHGLPVVVAEGDGTQDDLVRSENGWQVPPGDIQALKDVLQAALSDVSILRQKGTNSYRIVAEEANIEVMATRFVEAARAVSGGS